MESNIIGGFILISRKILESGIMKKPPIYFKVWMLLLLEARHKDGGGLKRGQLFTSIPVLQEKLSHQVGYRKQTPTKKQIWGILEWLRNPYEGDAKGYNEGAMIVTTKVTHGMVVTICNYDVYQAPKNYEGNDEGRAKVTTKVLRRERQGNNINKNVKNVKNVKNDKNVIKDIYSVKSLQEIALKFPGKKIKKVRDQKLPKLLEQYGEEQIGRCIKRYAAECQGRDRKYILNESTFWNGRYMDYLDENYNPEPAGKGTETDKPANPEKTRAKRQAERVRERLRKAREELDD